MSTQIKDKAIFNEKEYVISEDPLRQYLWTVKRTITSRNNANGRGYQCFWKIVENELYLMDIESDNLTLLELFKTDRPILASWYTGEISFLDGYSCDFDGYTSYSSKFVVTIMAGRVLSA